MHDARDAPRSYSIHDTVARESLLSNVSGSLSACNAVDDDIYSEDDDTGPIGMQCLPTLSRRVRTPSICEI